MRVAAVFAAVAALAAAALTPPGAPPTRRGGLLDRLPVRAETSTAGYSRGEFPHWVTVSGACDTRETVLRAQGVGVTVDRRCRPVAGAWTSPYDGATWDQATDVDVDHLVPLAEAWTSGAQSWPRDRRRAFANDLEAPELVAVTDDVNRAKSDRDPAQWLPPLTSYRCTYAQSWVQVKHRWGLTVDPAEKAALAAVLRDC